MRSDPPDLYESEGESIVLHRALGHEMSPTFTVIEVADGGKDALVHDLRSLGWAEVGATAADTTHLLLGDDENLGVLTDAARARVPDVIAVRQRDARVLRTWPGWDDDVIGLGYAGCLFTGSWRFYVNLARAEELGPRLTFAATPDELLAGGTSVREELVKEVVRWRAAALDRWVTTTTSTSTSTSTSTAAEAEAHHLRTVIAATHSTWSWRITRPLRAVQTRRLTAVHGRRLRGAKS